MSRKPQASWKKNRAWLEYTDSGMVCTLCTYWQNKIESVKNFSGKFIKGSTNFKTSAVVDHERSQPHLKAVEYEDTRKAEEEGLPLPRVHIQQSIPDSSAIKQCFNKMAEGEKNSMMKLFDLAYVLAKKGRPYSDFADFIEVEKAHGVTYTVKYDNNKQCEQFTRFISQAIFNRETVEKLKRCNFFTVLCDGSTDSSVIEKECIYTLFVDPDTFEIKLTFFSLEDAPSQDADGLVAAIENAFRKNGLEDILSRMVFLCSDGASVNSGLVGGVAAKFREKGIDWLTFVWCISHRLELAMKDSLGNDLSVVKTALTNLYYLYQKSSKKLRELRQMHDVLKEIYDFEDGQLKPAKVGGTRWIAHYMRSMNGFIDKFGVYLQHLENVISDTSKKCDRATLEGKRRQLVNAEVILKCCVFVDLLDSAKKFSLASQFKDTDILMLVERIDDMKSTYQRFAHKFRKSPESVLTMPTIKKVLDRVEKDEDGDYIYQGIRLNYFEKAKQIIINNILSYVESILKCIGQRFGVFCGDDNTIDDIDERILRGDKVLHDVVRTVDNRNWIIPDDDEAVNADNYLLIQMKSIEVIYEQYKTALHAAKPDISLDDLKSEYKKVVLFARNNVNHVMIHPKQFWQFVNQRKENRGWENILILIELCWCAPFTNAHLERFFSQMKIVKTDWRNRLNAENLTDLLRIKVEGPEFHEFRKSYCDDAVNMWFNDRSRRLQQGKRKTYKKRVTLKEKAAKLDFDLPSIFDDKTSSDDDEIADFSFL